MDEKAQDSPNPPLVIGTPVPPMSLDELMAWHANNGDAPGISCARRILPREVEERKSREKDFPESERLRQDRLALSRWKDVGRMERERLWVREVRPDGRRIKNTPALARLLAVSLRLRRTLWQIVVLSQIRWRGLEMPLNSWIRHMMRHRIWSSRIRFDCPHCLRLLRKAGVMTEEELQFRLHYIRTGTLPPY